MVKGKRQSLTSIAKNVHVLINLTVFISLCTKISFKFNELFLYESPESKFDLAIYIYVMVNPTTIEHSWAKIFMTFNEICSSIFLFDLNRKYVINPKSLFSTILVLLKNPMLLIKLQDHRSIGSGEEDFLKVFTMYRHGGLVVHMTRTVWTIFVPSAPGGSTWNLVKTGPVAWIDVWHCHIPRVLGHRSKNDFELLWSQFSCTC